MPEEVAGVRFPNLNFELAETLLNEHGAADWYQWAVLNWGTKWGTYEAELLYSAPNHLEYYYETAWSPLGDEAMKKLSSQFSELRIEVNYADPSNGIWGTAEVADGEIVGSRSGILEYDVDDDAFTEIDGRPLPKEIMKLIH